MCFALTGILSVFIYCSENFSENGGLCYAGNDELVKNRVDELDTLNEEIIKNIPNLPNSGSINVKAHVIDSEKEPQVIIIEKKIEPQINNEFNFLYDKNTKGH